MDNDALYYIESIDEKRYIGLNSTHDIMLQQDCEIVSLKVGQPCTLAVYINRIHDWLLINTSVVDYFEDVGNMILIATQNSIYSLWRKE